MKKIKLGRSGRVTVVDDGDYAMLSGYRWFLHRSGLHQYVRRWPVSGEGRSPIYMHRQILGLVTEEVDHIDGDGLNNRRSNLRPVSKQQNQFNRGITEHSSSYKGVSWRPDRRCWRAYIGVRDDSTGSTRYLHLGHFDNEVDAALAYNSAATNHFGEYAKLNEVKK